MVSIAQITRLLIIIRKLNSSIHYSKKELLSVVNRELNDLRDYEPISERTLERDIKTLKDSPFNINIILDRLTGYAIADNNFDGLDIEQLLEPFDILNALNADTGLQHIILTEKYTSRGTEHLYTLIKSIKNSQTISFDYQKYLEVITTERTVQPYAIKLLKGQWYVIGKEGEENDFKSFGLDRVKNLRNLKKKFKKDNGIDIKEKFQHSFGIYSSEEYPIENVILSFDKIDGNYLKTVPLHQSQEIVTESDDRVTLKLRLRITEDFVMALMSRSWSLKVIEPVDLKIRMCDIYKNALARNLI